MKYVINHIPIDTPYNRRPNMSMTPEYITIHSTANPKSTAKNERDWLTNSNNNRTASWHICVDENEAIEAIPLNEVAWHAGDGYNGIGNRKSIAIEICESGDRNKVIQNTVELVAKMLYERNWDISRLKRHYDWSGKNCPRILSYDSWKGWEEFKNMVEQRLNEFKNNYLTDIKIKLHDKEIIEKGIFKDGVNYVPIRFLEKIGYKLDWDGETETVLIDYK